MGVAIIIEIIIESKNLTFKNILTYPDININKDMVTFISGASGCGKSTLFKIFNGTISPSSGYVLYHGENIDTLNKIELRRKILLIKQVPYLFRGSIYENFLTFHKYHESDCPSQSKIYNFLKLCCIETDLNIACDNMSGGEQQRIFLSIALSLTPQVLLLDEPTSALNKELSNDVIKNIIDYSKQQNISLLIISHDTNLQSIYAEDIIKLER